MDTATVLLVVLLAAASVLCAVAVWGVFELVKTARSVRLLTDDLRARVIPLLEKADVALDVVNVGLLRMDEIVTRVEDVTDRVSSTSRTVQEVANAPVEIVSNIADRVREAWRMWRYSKTTHAQTDEPDTNGERSPRHV